MNNPSETQQRIEKFALNHLHDIYGFGLTEIGLFNLSPSEINTECAKLINSGLATNETVVLSILTICYLISKVVKLQKAVDSLTAQQLAFDERINKLNRTTKKATNKQRAFDRKLKQQRQKQERLQKEQQKLRAEQAKQTETINKMQFKLNQALADIEAGKVRLAQLYALLDIAENNRAGAVPGSSADVRYQRQIITITNQIHSTEKRIAKAEFDRNTAKAAIAA